MLGLSCALAAVLAAPGGLADGTWLPTRGGAGERLIQAVAGGGDGALYAAGAGRVYRLVPGQSWQSLGLYAPTLSFSRDDGVEADGPFDPRFLDRVERDVFVALRASHGLDVADADLEDIANDLLVQYTEEVDPQLESPYRIARMVPSTRGVWLATGSGLFWADAKGVSGPIGELPDLIDIVATPKGLAAQTTRSLYRVEPTGRSKLWLDRKVESLTTVGGRVAFVSDGRLYVESDTGQMRPISPPTGTPKLVAGDRDVLWVITALAMFRWQNDAWSLCAAAPVAAERIVAGADSVALLSERSVHTTDSNCAKLNRLDPPWLGPLQMTDVALFAGSLWGSSTEGVFVWGPPDAAAEEGLREEAFRRAVSRLPEFLWVYETALDYGNITRADHSYGSRPALAGLLPNVRGRAFTRPERREVDPTLLAGNDQLDQEQPRFNWDVMFEWRVRFDLLGLVLGSNAEIGDTETEVDLDGLAESDIDPSVDIQEGQESVLVEIAEAPVDNLGNTAADVAYQQVLADQRQRSKDSAQLYQRLRGLYRDRIRVMRSTLGASNSMVFDLLQLSEIDAQIDGLTGGAFSRRLGARAPAPKEGG